VSAAIYDVVCDLSYQGFDEARLGLAAARAAAGEVRRLGRRDPTVRSVRSRRRGSQVVEVRLTLDARSSREAFDVASAILRTALHGLGACTAGWESIQPRIGVARARRGGPADRSGMPLWQPPADWAAHAAAARRVTALAATLPPLSAIAQDATPTVIDLR
jgi:hypothetical protein